MGPNADTALQPRRKSSFDSRCCYTGLPPQLLELEVTESLVWRMRRARSKFSRSSSRSACRWRSTTSAPATRIFGRLRELSVDRLKIDRSFVNRMHSDPDDRALVSAMVKMAQTIGIDVIAEGAEIRPLPPAEAGDFLKRAVDTRDGPHGAPAQDC